MIGFRWGLIVVMSGFLTACGEREPATAEILVIAEESAPVAPSCELVMGWDPWEPYQYEIAGGQVFGLDVDLVTAVARQADCSLTFEKGTWGDLLQRLRDGEIDLLAGATPTEERQTFAWFTVPYRDEQFELFTRTDRLESVDEYGLAALMAEGWQIGVVEGYLYNDAIKALQDADRLNGGFVYSPMAEINISLLLDGVVDGIVEDKYVGAAIIRHKNLQDDISPLAMGFKSTEISIMVSRASVDEALFERLDESVQTLSANGAIDKILAQYAEP